MTRAKHHPEHHSVSRIGWLRAAVLGANDGIVSTASLIVGVAAANTDRAGILVAGMAALIAGAMSMAAGEYVSVSSQADTERADLEKEARELVDRTDLEQQELADIYTSRGVEAKLALKVAEQLMARDALGAHARDELGISEITTARPLQAAGTSALTFSMGATAPLLFVLASPQKLIVPMVSLATLLCLALLGYLGARAGGANINKSIMRVTFWGALALVVTAGIGKLFGTVV